MCTDLINSLEPRELATSIIALVNIIVTIVLTMVNIFFLSRTNKFATKRDVFCNYYLPIVDILNEIECLLFDGKSPIDVFDANLEVEQRLIRKEIIEVYYDKLLQFMNKEFRYYDKKIDNEIFNIKEHIYFMCRRYNNREAAYDVETVKKRYPIPKYKNIISMIRNNYCHINRIHNIFNLK